MRTVRQVTIRDNGMTSFVPPTFKWDLVNEETQTVEVTVSDVRAGDPKMKVEEILRSDIQVEGFIEEYPEANGQTGLRLIITEINKF